MYGVTNGMRMSKPVEIDVEGLCRVTCIVVKSALRDDICKEWLNDFQRAMSKGMSSQ